MSHCAMYNDPADCDKSTCEGCKMKNSNVSIPKSEFTDINALLEDMDPEEREACESDPCFQCLAGGNKCIIAPDYDHDANEVGTCLAGRC